MQNYNVINYVYTCNVYYYELIMSFEKRLFPYNDENIHLCIIWNLYVNIYFPKAKSIHLSIHMIEKVGKANVYYREY